MKVLHVTEVPIGGTLTYIEGLIPYQSEQLARDNVVVLVPDNHKLEPETFDKCRIETYGRTGRNPKSIWALAMAILRTVADHKPDVVHLHSSFAGAIGRLALLAVKPRPVVIYCAHCWSFDRSRRSVISRFWQAIELLLAPLTDVIVNISPFENRLLQGAGFPMRKVALIVTGLEDLPLSHRTPPLLQRAPGNPIRLLFAGRMDQQKGVDLLLQEMKTIDPKRVSLTIIGRNVGGGYEVSDHPNITTFDWVERETLPIMLGNCDAVIMPSRWESASIWAMEVMRSGRLLLGSNQGIFRDIIQIGVNGLLMDIDKPGFLDRALKCLEGADLEQMGASARRTFECIFQHDRMNQELMDLYRRSLEARNSRSVEGEISRNTTLSSS